MDAEGAPPPPRTGTRITRAALLGRLAAGLGAVTAGGAAAANLATATGAGSSLSSGDLTVFEFALTIERLQAAFYSQAAKASAITGEAKQFAQIVAAEEAAHLHYLLSAIGSSAGHAPQFTFGDALASTKSFVAVAVKIEETGLAAYNGQATNLSAKGLAELGRVISVEARHAAWARALDGRQPAPVAIDVPISAAEAQQAIKPYIA